MLRFSRALPALVMEFLPSEGERREAPGLERCVSSFPEEKWYILCKHCSSWG